MGRCRCRGDISTFAGGSSAAPRSRRCCGSNGASALLACSALKQKYRDRLAAGCSDLRWVYLKGSFELIESRLKARKGHYMKAGLLESQFAALEEPADAIIADIGATPEAIADAVEAALTAACTSAAGSRR